MTDLEKGLLIGLKIDIESIKNQLIIEEEKITQDLDGIMEQLQQLVDTK